MMVKENSKMVQEFMNYKFRPHFRNPKEYESIG